MIVVPGWRAAASSTFSVTVSPRSVSTIARVGLAAGLDGGLVEPVGRGDVEAEGLQRRQVRLDRAGAEVAAAGVRQLEAGHLVQQRAEEHDHGAGAAGGVDVDAGEVEAGRGHDLEVVAVGQPAHPDADRGEHLDDPVDLLDAGQAAQRGAALVEQAGAEQGDGGVLARLDRDRAGELLAADDPQVLGAAVAERDELAVELLADPGEHLQGEVLLALLDAGDRALAGAEQVGELALGQALVAPGVPDQGADPGQVRVGRGGGSHLSSVYHL